MEGRGHNIIVPRRKGPPECPLCKKIMREVTVKNPQPVIITSGWTPITIYYVCLGLDCMISIRKNDPCIKTWDTIQKPKCQLCGKDMRVFVRSDRTLIMICKDPSHYPYRVARGDAKYLPPINSGGK